MISSLIREALKARLIMLVIALALVGFGIRSTLKLSVDAFPDVTNVQVQIANPQAVRTQVLSKIPPEQSMFLHGQVTQKMVQQIQMLTG